MMNRIFITIPWFTPAYKAGGPVRSVDHLVCQFKGETEFFIFCGTKDLDGSVLSDITFDRWVKYNEKTSVFYCSQNLRKQYKAQLKLVKPDQLYSIGIFSWGYNIFPVIHSKNINRILSVRGMLHPGALSQKPLKKRIFLTLFKWLGIHRKITFHATDETEAGFIYDYFGKKVNVKIAGNFPLTLSNLVNKSKDEKLLRLIGVGIVSPMKNYLEVLKALKGIKENVIFDIIGPVKDFEYWKQCLHIIGQLPPNIKVNVMGEIPSGHIADHLIKADVFIMPSKSENFGHAHFEALSMGLPMITSHNTPWNQLQIAKAGLNIEVHKEAIFEAITFFQKMDASEYSKWSKGARDYAVAKINVDSLNLQYAVLFKNYS